MNWFNNKKRKVQLFNIQYKFQQIKSKILTLIPSHTILKYVPSMLMFILTFSVTATEEQKEVSEPTIVAAAAAEPSAVDPIITATAADTAVTSESAPSIPNEADEIGAKVAALQAALATESGSTFSSTYAGELPPPFPELEYLSLAHNKVIDRS